MAAVAAAVSSGEDKRAALKAKMKQVLQSKGSGETTTTLVDPWPEIRIPATLPGIEDGRKRAEELQRRGNFSYVVKMWQKIMFLARTATSPLPPEEMAKLIYDESGTMLLLEEWKQLEAACKDGLQLEAHLTSPQAAKLYLRRARSQAELKRDFKAALQLREEVLAKCSDDDVVEEAKDLELRVKKLELQLQEAKMQQQQQQQKQQLQQKQPPWAVTTTVSKPLASPPASSEASRTQRKAVGSGDRSDSAVERNQAFFDKFQREWEETCAADGWGNIGYDENKENATARIRPATANSEEIPAQSDYHSVIARKEGDRELRATKTPSAAAATTAKQASSTPLCRRNLDDLRRVEAETRKAIEAELRRQQQAVKKAKNLSKVNLDSLSDGESDEDAQDDAEESNSLQSISDLERAIAASLSRTQLPQREEYQNIVPPSMADIKRMTDDENDSDSEDEEQRKIRKAAEAGAHALEEFERIGREKEQLLAQWRDRWG
mmetsp:Transcript_1308/g.2898  ORF Transcript_1308/g.2898 Transcript_1308/m.2898 type:complete len:493 (-) Transcript_1308:23-1501(-)